MDFLSMDHASVGLRVAVPSDAPFLRRLYLSVREPELKPFGWSNEQVTIFCDMQYRYRQSSYMLHGDDLATSIAEVGGLPIGRMDVATAAEEWRLVNIELLPAWRGQGIGRYLLEEFLLLQAAQGRVNVHLSVACNSEARRLYERCGFVFDASDGMHDRMLWLHGATR